MRARLTLHAAAAAKQHNISLFERLHDWGVALYLIFELVAGMKGHHPASFNGDRLPGPGVTARPGGLGTYLEVAKAGNLDIIAFHQAIRNEVKKRVYHVLGFAFIEPNMLK